MYEIFEKLLEIKGVKTADVCKATGLKAPTFSDWKRGKSKPNTDKMILIAEYFGVSVEYLTTGQEPKADYLYTDENAEFLIEFTNQCRNKEFLERMIRYMSLTDSGRKTIDDNIDFMFEREQKKGEN